MSSSVDPVVESSESVWREILLIHLLTHDHHNDDDDDDDDDDDEQHSMFDCCGCSSYVRWCIRL